MVNVELEKKFAENKEMPIRRTAVYLLPDYDLGDPATQLVGLVVFLASDEASYIQGAVFSDDCGITV